MAVTSQNASEKMRETLPPTSGDFGTLHYPESSLFASLAFAFFILHIYGKRFSQNLPVYLFNSLSLTLFSPLANLLYLLSPSVRHWIRLQASFIAVPPPLVSASLSPASPPLPPSPIWSLPACLRSSVLARLLRDHPTSSPRPLLSPHHLPPDSHPYPTCSEAVFS